ncbi:putative aconitase [Rhizobium sp. BK313]|nr:putative aconitase [Rhizobium sp. BK313]
MWVTRSVSAKGLTDAYVQMGAMPTFACAPHLPDCRALESPKVFFVGS